MKGKRVYLNNDGELLLASGDYGKNSLGIWIVRPPKGHLGNVDNHTVVEHEDGTITVSPSILITDRQDNSNWHGYLTKGEWREC